jgi:hypothetical protein
MSLRERLFGRKGRLPELDLAALQGQLAGAVSRYAGRPTEAELLRARLADGCRDAGVPPLLPEQFDALVQELDEEARRRLAVLASALDLEAVRGALGALAEVRPLGGLVGAAFAGLAQQTPLLTLELLRQSRLRVEELARKFAARLGAALAGESPEESRRQLERLDYRRLLAQAEQARQAARERAERVRKLQDEQEQNRPRRGKW